MLLRWGRDCIWNKKGRAYVFESEGQSRYRKNLNFSINNFGFVEVLSGKKETESYGVGDLPGQIPRLVSERFYCHLWGYKPSSSGQRKLQNTKNQDNGSWSKTKVCDILHISAGNVGNLWYDEQDA